MRSRDLTVLAAYLETQYPDRSRKDRGLPNVSKSLQAVSGRLHNNTKVLRDKAEAQLLADSLLDSASAGPGRNEKLGPSGASTGVLFNSAYQ